MTGSRLRYPGAHPFSDDDVSRAVFFGRARESVALADQIIANQLVVLYAKSGLGKTSLLNAGVAERLRHAAHLPLIARVDNTKDGPFASVLDYVKARAGDQKVEYHPGETESLWSFFKTAEFWREDLLLTPVLILDQFEELFTLQTLDRMSAFASELSILIRGRPPGGEQRSGVRLSGTPPMMKVVISLREDYLGILEDLSDRIPKILDCRFRLAPLSIEAATEALTRPAAVQNAAFSTGTFLLANDTIDAILRHLSRRSADAPRAAAPHIEPFHLQLICAGIEEKAIARQQQGQLHPTFSLTDLGGEDFLRTTLQDFYLGQLKNLPDSRTRRAVRRLCDQHLISPRQKRLSMEETEIERLLRLNTSVLAQLVKTRLLRTDRRANATYYEISHDSLVEPILASRRSFGRKLGYLNLGAALLVMVPAFAVLALVVGLLVGFATSEIVAEKVVGPAIVATLLLVLSVPFFIVARILFKSGRVLLQRYRRTKGNSVS